MRRLRRAPRAPEAERITGICGSRAGVLASKRATHLHLGCSNAHLNVGRRLRGWAAVGQVRSSTTGSGSACYAFPRPPVKLLRLPLGTLTVMWP